MYQSFSSIFASASSSQPYMILLPIALILITGKVLSIFCKKIGIPQVVGYLLSGLLLGLITFIPGQPIFTSGEGGTMEGINFIAKIGVVLIMFSAGLETDLGKIKSTGVSSLVVTALGVLFPMALGFLAAYLFFPNDGIYVQLFYGVLLSATSVSITVSVLKEIGKLNTRVGACIESAAILDDIIGIILLSLILSLSNSSGTASGVPFGIDTGNSGLNLFLIVVFMLAFFAICIALWWPIKKLFTWLNEKWPNHRRIPVFGFALAFLLAWVAESFFGVADITGGFMAGLILSTTMCKDYVDAKADSESGIIFGPIFFSSVGLMLFTTAGLSFDMDIIWFGIVFVIVGLLGKVIGAGLGGLMTRFSIRDSLKIGIGMMARAEVIVVCAQKGINAGLVNAEVMVFVLLLIIVSSFLTPIFLKLLYRDEIMKDKELARGPSAPKA